MGNNFSYEESINNSLYYNDLSKLKSLLKKKKLSTENINILFDKACRMNCLQIVLFLIDYENIILESNTIKYILKNNYYDIFLVLVQKNILAPDQDLFEMCCLYNFNYICLIDSLNNNIELTKNAFLNSCLSNNLKNIIFFLNKGFDFEMEDDILFHYVCNNCSIKIINHFCKICFRYNYIYDEYENITPKIKSKDEYFIENRLWNDLINYKNIKLIDNYIKEECVISLCDSNFVTNCKHHFEISSILDWYLKKKECPLCTTKIDLEKCLIDSSFFNK